MTELTWARAGLTRLTGRPGGPTLAAPPDVDERLQSVVTHVLRSLRGIDMRADEADLFGLFARRAELAGFGRGGTTSCGGGTRLLDTADGVVAVNRSRPSDDELLAAWLDDGSAVTGIQWPIGSDGWTEVQGAARRLPTTTLVERGVLLGLAVGAVAESGATSGGAIEIDNAVRWVSTASRRGGPRDRKSLAGVRVVDLSALWAGPLCCHLLAKAGASVHVVESVARPDPTARMHAAFHAELRAGMTKEKVDLAATAGRARYVELVRSADIVVSSARPRALAGIGCDPTEIVAADDGPLWLAITGHGWVDAPERVGFGDDAAVAGGLVARDDEGIVFAGDAIADPLTGLLGAAAIINAWTSGRRGLLDASLARSAAVVAGGSVEPWLAVQK